MEKKLLIITGASSGIGLATAKIFLHHCYAVINISRRPCPLENVANIKMDLRHCDTKALSFALSQIVRPNQIALVHNASRLDKDSFENVEKSAFQEILSVNILAPVELNQWAIPFMGPGSSILYVGSTLSEKAVANAFSYVTTKHAQAGMMKATCQDLIATKKEIHTALICPGFTDTKMLREHIGTNQASWDSLMASNNYGRLIQPEEIAETIYFAATNPVMNGAILHANLGQKG